MLLWPPLTGTQCSPVAPHSCALPSGPSLGNRHDRRTKPGKVFRCCVCLQTQYVCSLPLPFTPTPPSLPPPASSSMLFLISPLPSPLSSYLSPPPIPSSISALQLPSWNSLGSWRDKVDTAALSETRFSEQGQLEEVGVGHTSCWYGWSKAERRDAGVAFAIQRDVVGRSPCFPRGLTDHLISLRRPLWGDNFAIIVSAEAYLPPMTNSEEAKNEFYKDLHALLATATKMDK
ncbi:unnamed protein product [Schistocephalus solidus]|uniref:WS_DGAT_C domain-containing protein n=1 Tax=Schistocephalus solidus TaxID=70667 RepID=A0A183T379_SCHSO|nr:unnamed protein product [Schistocephalus solidus]